MADQDKDELLDMNFCHCGTVRELIDESIDAAIALKDEGKCAIWQQQKALMTVQMLANIFGLMEHAKVGKEEGQKNTAEFMNDMFEQQTAIMRDTKEYLRDRLHEKLYERAKKEAEKHGATLVLGNAHLH